jgi:formate/nitrite transporter FocA (FNT family)
VLCNLLVSLAVWLTMAGRSVADKILAIGFPVTVGEFPGNLLPVTPGNIVGGAGQIGLVSYLISGRQEAEQS